MAPSVSLKIPGTYLNEHVRRLAAADSPLVVNDCHRDAGDALRTGVVAHLLDFFLELI